ncbi:T9SS type A sorting domain-containing protein [Aquimarina sp. W85]|uniref:T9SS type A sorting domain-containing protein n=1 Tax=Aquimarina rhodophyticola TaxID=3342246 RepID=UPI00366FDD8E
MKKVLLTLLLLLICNVVFSQYMVRYDITATDPNDIEYGYTEIEITDNLNNLNIYILETGDGLPGDQSPRERRNRKGSPSFEGLPSSLRFNSAYGITADATLEECNNGTNIIPLDLPKKPFFGPYVNGSETYFNCDLALEAGFIQIFKLNNLPSPGEKSFCEEDTIILNPGNFHPSIKRVLYQISTMARQEVLFDFSSEYKYSAMVNLSTLNLENAANIRFQLDYGTVQSNTQIYNLRKCSPKIVDVSPTQTNCSDSTDGGFVIELDRTIEANDALNFDLFIVDNDGANVLEVEPEVIAYRDDIKRIDGKYYYTWPDTLDVGRYRVQFQTNSSAKPEVSEIFNISSPDPVSFTTSSTDIPCATAQGESIYGTITINATGGNAPYEYQIDDEPWVEFSGSTTVPKEVGTYAIKVRDKFYSSKKGGCIAKNPDKSEKILTETIRPATAIVINGSSTDATYAGRANGAIIATVQGGTPVSNGPTYTYSWRSDPVVTIPPATTTNPDNTTFEIYLQDLPAATYTLDITDGNGCTESSEFIVSEPPPLVFDTLLNTDVICGDNDATNDDGTVSAKATGGIPPYQYQLLRKNELDVFEAYGMPVVLEETQTFEATMLSGGVYQVQLADNTEDPQNTNPMVLSTEIEIIQPQPFFIQNITLEEAQCIGQASGSMTFDILGGTGTYILELLKEGDPAFQRVIENIPHNSMGVTVGDLSRGVYTLNIIDENMCELINPFVQRIVTIKDPSLIYNVDLGNNKVLCKDQTHTVDAFISDPMAHYVWQADNGFSSQDSQITIDKTGLYSVIVTTALGCEITSSIDVVVLDQPILPEFVVPSDLFAKESFILVDVSNPLPDTVEWLVPKEAIVTESSQGYAEIAFKKTGTYELVMKTTIGACEAFATKTIEVRAASFDKKNNGNSELSLYPNPSQGDFTIDLTFEQEAPVDIKLFSMVNNALLYSQTSTAKKIHLVDLNLKGSLSTGVYLLLLQSPEKNYVRKIVVE